MVDPGAISGEVVQMESPFALARRRIQNFLLDIRFGRPLYGSEPSRYAELGAHSTENSSYSCLKKMFAGQIKVNDVLVDVGCGKGRVINWWLSQGLRNQLIGIELDEVIAAETQRRLSQFNNVRIIPGDATEMLPSESSIVYLYNPFDARVMLSFKSRVKSILYETGRKGITLIYSNPKHLDIFRSDPQCAMTLGKALHPFAIIQVRSR
jgi:SAM-dependent methyltransferase